MNSEDINTNINNFQEPNNLGQVNNVSTPMIGNNQNYQQPFIAEAPRILRHTQEFEKEVKSGCCMLIVILCIAIVIIALIVVIACVGLDCWPVIPVIVLLFIFQMICIKGFFTNTPNVAHVITYFGNYLGSVKKVGLFWINPFYSHNLIDLKRNIFSSEVIKVNDKAGNPIMMGCIVVWKVKDTAKAFFDVENYRNYVRIQTETAIRYIGCKYPYEKINKDDICLRSGHNEINMELKRELIERLEPSGIDVVEAYINELSYAPEIATVMLKRQGAQAIIAAREKIVQGAVSIAGHAVHSLKENSIVELNDDEKSDIVSNLILVLCTEADVRPVVNAGAGALS
jgi:energy-coupling factor transporter transmembrane protein EcfT